MTWIILIFSSSKFIVLFLFLDDNNNILMFICTYFLLFARSMRINIKPCYEEHEYIMTLYYMCCIKACLIAYIAF
jgi:hypothetical protein